jgi:hypothetical protein
VLSLSCILLHPRLYTSTAMLRSSDWMVDERVRDSLAAAEDGSSPSSASGEPPGDGELEYQESSSDTHLLSSLRAAGLVADDDDEEGDSSPFKRRGHSIVEAVGSSRFLSFIGYGVIGFLVFFGIRFWSPGFPFSVFKGGFWAETGWPALSLPPYILCALLSILFTACSTCLYFEARLVLIYRRSDRQPRAICTVPRLGRLLASLGLLPHPSQRPSTPWSSISNRACGPRHPSIRR